MPPVVYGKYQLLELLARGGMAEVFKAKSHGVEGFEKILVIKRILPDLSENPQFVEMFINEAKIAVTLSHANVVQVFDLGRADDTYFIAMEYVAGFDLATVLKQGAKHGRPLPPELAVYIISEIAKGLDYAHRRRDASMRPLNIVHRDVSPQNVLLSFEGEVKLTDFGIAKARTTVDEAEEDGVLKGKYAYMSPEQASGRDVDSRTDIFALGTCLYEALAGRSPFAHESAYETLKLVRDGECAPVDEVADQVPEELSQIVSVAMSPDPDERHPNAGRLYEDLIQFLYSSGRRVGAHDLSRYLDELREAGERKGVDSSNEIMASFHVDAAAIAHEGPGATPAEAPSSKGTGAGSRPGSRPRKSSATFGAPERRDVTSLAVLIEPQDQTPPSTIHSLLKRFGGTITEEAKTSDGRWLIVMFGSVDADGRDTEAATRCGLRISRAAEASRQGAEYVGLRVGVHTGRLHADPEGEVLTDEAYHRLLDKTRALARRGDPGRVMLSPAAHRSVRTLFSFDEESHEGGAAVALGEKSMADVHGKFVGRRNELRRIGEILAFANQGRRRIIAVVGEPGTGKSRLISETVRRFRLGGHDVGMHIVRLTRQGRDVPLSAIREMLQVVLGIDELDPAPLIRDKVARLRELGLASAEIRSVGIALGLDHEDTVAGAVPGRRPLIAGVAHIATRLAEDRLTVFAFDGVEYMDEESQGLISRLLRDSPDSRLGVVVAYRRGHVHPWSDLPGYHEVEVGPLDDEDVMRLVGDRLGAEEVPMDLLRDVKAKSGGNPLYLEEYLAALEDAGALVIKDGKIHYRRDIAEVEVPKTLRGMVAARVARLGQVERQLLSVAAVVGPRFTADILCRVAGLTPRAVSRSLNLLETRTIVLRKGPSEYEFTHELLGDVLRDSLTLEGKKRLHSAVAYGLEELYPERTEELAERLAYHFRLGGDKAKAIDYLVRAADRLETEHSLDAAVGNLVKAIDLLGQTQSPDRDRVLNLYRRVGELAFRSRNLTAGADQMAAGLELAEELGRDEFVARFAMMRGRLLVNANEFEEGRKWLERARDVAGRLSNRELLRDVTLATAEGYNRNGQYASASGLLEEALALSRDTGDLNAQIRCLIPLALAVAAVGDEDKGRGHLEEARRLAGMHPDRYTDIELLKTEALIAFYLRQHQGVVDASARALELSKEWGFWHEAAVNAHNLGEGYLRLGDFKRAFSNLRYSYELAKEHSATRIEYMNLRVLGFIDAVRFESPEGRRRLVEATEFAKRHDYHWDYVQSLYMLGIAEAHLDDPESARQHLREAMRLAAELGDSRNRVDSEAALRALDAGDPLPMPG
ncbi:MAG: protein kinase [Deltaproteobacteria bacterium]|nr:protein kinase [Deltaproteobacteria bacterium]